MAALVIFDGAGPLPQTFTFNSPISGGSATFVLNGTAWTQYANTLVEIALILDGSQIGSAMCFANQSAVHMTLRPSFIEVASLSYAQHTMQIVVANSTTVSDFNDYFQVTLLY